MQKVTLNTAALILLAFFTACSQASKAADYLRSLAIAGPAERAA